MKADITVKNGSTINIGNFSNVQPSISITLKDIDVKNIQKYYQQLSDIVNDMLVLETATIIKETSSVLEIGAEIYANEIIKNKDKIENEIKTKLKEINLNE